MSKPVDSLDIVIPVYKTRYLPNLLESIARQTSGRFRVVVADDGSPEDVREVCDQYSSAFPLTYIRFDENLGSMDLVKHWNRAVESSEARWLLLPGDDDELESNCIESFWKTVEEEGVTSEVYSFGIRVIDESGKIVAQRDAAGVDSSAGFLEKRFTGKIYPMPVGYVFSRDVFERCNGFVSFDRGWHSDDASLAKFCAVSGIAPIRGAFVRWRESDINISPDMQRSSFRRTCASIEFVSWMIGSRSYLRISDEEMKRLISEIGYWPWYPAVSGSAGFVSWLSVSWRASRILCEWTSDSFSRHFFRFLRSKFIHS